eukprot:46824_2
MTLLWLRSPSRSASTTLEYLSASACSACSFSRSRESSPFFSCTNIDCSSLNLCRDRSDSAPPRYSPKPTPLVFTSVSVTASMSSERTAFRKASSCSRIALRKISSRALRSSSMSGERRCSASAMAARPPSSVPFCVSSASSCLALSTSSFLRFSAASRSVSTKAEYCSNSATCVAMNAGSDAPTSPRSASLAFSIMPSLRRLRFIHSVSVSLAKSVYLVMASVMARSWPSHSTRISLFTRSTTAFRRSKSVERSCSRSLAKTAEASSASAISCGFSSACAAAILSRAMSVRYALCRRSSSNLLVAASSYSKFAALSSRKSISDGVSEVSAASTRSRTFLVRSSKCDWTSEMTLWKEGVSFRYSTESSISLTRWAFITVITSCSRVISLCSSRSRCASSVRSADSRCSPELSCLTMSSLTSLSSLFIAAMMSFLPLSIIESSFEDSWPRMVSMSGYEPNSTSFSETCAMVAASSAISSSIVVEARLTSSRFRSDTSSSSIPSRSPYASYFASSYEMKPGSVDVVSSFMLSLALSRIWSRWAVRMSNSTLVSSGKPSVLTASQTSTKLSEREARLIFCRTCRTADARRSRAFTA